MPRPAPDARTWARLLARICLLAIFLVSLPLHAADLGKVTGIFELDDAGHWSKVDMSAGTVCMRDGVSTPLRPGFDLDEGDRLKTQKAKVSVDLGGGVLLLIQLGSDVVLGLRNVQHNAGGAYYQVDAPWEITIDGLVVAVEGTRFMVAGTDPVLVSVNNGTVRVTSKEEPVLVTRGEQVETLQGHVPGGVRSMSMSQRESAWEGSWPRGGPRTQLAVLAGGGLVGGGLGATSRVQASFDVALGITALLDAGMGALIQVEGARVPVGLGAAYQLGPVQLGAELITAYDAHQTSCNGDYRAIHFGGAALVQAGLSLSRRASLLAALRGGYAGDPLADLAVGVSWGF